MSFGKYWRTLLEPGEDGKRARSKPLLLILLFLGLALLLINSFLSSAGRERREAPPAPAESSGEPLLSTEEQLGRRLAEILTGIGGISEVEVFLAPGASGRVETAADEESSTRLTSEEDREGGSRAVTEETARRTHVILRDPQGNERPLVVEEGEPRYCGVLVVAAGVEDDAVKSLVVEALQALLGLPAHRITVLPRS